MGQLRQREPAFDVIRTIAILMVVTIHVTAPAIQRSPGSANWWLALIWGVVARPAVPLFFMCSGALMLGRNISLKRLYGHNLLRILIAMFCWGLAYNLIPVIKNLSLSSVWEAIKQTIVLKHEFHFYYLHILILVYVFVPVTQVFIRAASRREMEYLLAVWFVVGILFPVLRSVWPFSLVYTLAGNWYVMNMTYSAIGYGVLGCYLKRYGDMLPLWLPWTAWAAGAAFTYFGTAALSVPGGTLSAICLEGMSPGPMLMAFGLMGLLIRKKTWPPRLQAVTGRAAKASFCIYLVHVLVQRILEGVAGQATILSIVTIPALTLAIVIISWGVYEVLNLIPIVKKWLI